MALLPEDLRNLHLVLCGVILDGVELNTLTVTGEGLGVSLEKITQPAPLEPMILKVIQYFDAKGLSAELIRAAMKASPDSGPLKAIGTAILARLAAEAAAFLNAPQNPFEACLIEPGPEPFISRRVLREFLQQVNNPRGFPILVVNGLSKTGKSYSFRFITYLKRMLSAYDLAWVDLSSEVHVDYRPETLAEDISILLGWDQTSLPKRPSNRYPKELTRWVLGQWSRIQAGRAAPSPLVVVLDGFHQPELYGETREFVQELIKQVAANTTQVRLVLLNYSDELLPPNLPPIRREPLAPLSRPEVVEFFTGVHRQVSSGEPNKKVIEGIVDQVLKQVPLGDPAYNELLNKRVREAAELLIAPAQP
jgi:hypothetical protein